MRIKTHYQNIQVPGARVLGVGCTSLQHCCERPIALPTEFCSGVEVPGEVYATLVGFEAPYVGYHLGTSGSSPDVFINELSVWRNQSYRLVYGGQATSGAKQGIFYYLGDSVEIPAGSYSDGVFGSTTLNPLALRGSYPGLSEWDDFAPLIVRPDTQTLYFPNSNMGNPSLSFPSGISWFPRSDVGSPIVVSPSSDLFYVPCEGPCYKFTDLDYGDVTIWSQQGVNINEFSTCGQPWPLLAYSVTSGSGAGCAPFDHLFGTAVCSSIDPAPELTYQGQVSTALYKQAFLYVWCEAGQPLKAEIRLVSYINIRVASKLTDPGGTCNSFSDPPTSSITLAGHNYSVSCLYPFYTINLFEGDATEWPNLHFGLGTLPDGNEITIST